MRTIVAIGLVGLLGVSGAAHAAAPYYAYVSLKQNIDCSNTSNCTDTLIRILNPIQKTVAAELATTNPIATLLNTSGSKLVIAKRSVDGNNSVFLDVMDTATLKIMPVAQRTSAYCRSASTVAIATIDGLDTAIVPCAEGLTLYPIDKAYPDGTGTRVVIPSAKTFYYSHALSVSSDNQWLFGVGVATTSTGTSTLGVSAIKLQDLALAIKATEAAPTTLDSLVSVGLDPRSATILGDTAAMAVLKDPATANKYSIVAASKQDGNQPGKAYLVQLHTSAATATPTLTKQLNIKLYNNGTDDLTLVDPRAITIFPSNFSVYIVDYGNANTGPDTPYRNGTLSRFEISQTTSGIYNTSVVSTNLAQDVPGRATKEGYAEVHPVNLGVSPDGGVLYLLETQWNRKSPPYSGTYLRRYALDRNNGLVLPSEFLAVNQANANASGTLIGPECDNCYLPPRVATPKSRNRPAAVTTTDIALLLTMLGIVAYGRRRALRVTRRD
ncbi:MAG: hypothetical protein OEW08_08850 [Gammaproteobacteria bacterium]|nr:hypothetical protein [Gammaproteobacteria bacterium]